MTEPSSLETVRDAYDTWADAYVERLSTVESVHADDLALVERWAAVRSGRVLDVGSGPGHLTAFLHARGVDVVGVEPSAGFRAHSRRAHPQVPFVSGALPCLDVADASLAAVLAWYSLIHHRPDELETALAEVHRVLRPGGVLVVGFFDGDVVAPFEHRVVTAHWWPVQEMASRLAAALFVEVERETRAHGERSHAALVVRRT